MRHLKTHYHPDIKSLEGRSIFTRLATRSIALHHDELLLLYTERYDDFSLPGGGLEPHEDQVEGLIRELREETGAQGIRNIMPFGVYEEYRPWYKPDYELQRIISYCYTCEVDHALGASQLESYEQANGMRALWVNLYEAIAHNERTMASSLKKGMSIERETYLLRLIADELLNSPTRK